MKQRTTVAVLTAFAVTDSSAVVVKHDDGTPDGKKSLGGSGHMIKYSAPEGK